MAKRPRGRPQHVTEDGALHAELAYDRAYRAALDRGKNDQAARSAALDAMQRALREGAALDFDSYPPDLLKRVLTGQTSPEDAAREMGKVPHRFDGDREHARKLLDQRAWRAEQLRVESESRKHEYEAENEPALRDFHLAAAREWRASLHRSPREPEPSEPAMFKACLRTLALTAPLEMMQARILDRTPTRDSLTVHRFLGALDAISREVEDGDLPATRRAAFVEAAKLARTEIQTALKGSF